MNYEVPKMTAAGSLEQEIQEIKSFLYRQTERLNYNLKQTSVESIWQKTAEALSVSLNETVEQERRNEYRALRGLIIKAATSVIKNEDTFCAEFSGDYTAESPYGTLRDEGKFYVNGNPFTINQLWKYQSEIINDTNIYKSELEGFINTGILDRSGEETVFGMDIGYNKKSYKVDDTVVEVKKPAKVRITPDKISFHSGDTECAYLNAGAIHFPNAHITGGTIEIGKNFSVDNEGNFTATSGKIAGFCISGSATAANGFMSWSLSNIVRTNKGKVDADNPEYAVFLRGQSDDREAGARGPSNIVMGVKYRTSTSAKWSDSNATPYTFYVSARGLLYATNANIRGTVNATSGTIAGFSINGADSDTIPNSLTSIIKSNDRSPSQNYPEYLTYFNSTTEGANDNTVILGTKERTSTDEVWNSTANHSWSVTLGGSAMFKSVGLKNGASFHPKALDSTVTIISTITGRDLVIDSGGTLEIDSTGNLTVSSSGKATISSTSTKIESGSYYYRVEKSAATVDGVSYYHLMYGAARFTGALFLSNGNVYMKTPCFYFYTSQAVSGSNWLQALYFGTVSDVSAFHIGMGGKDTRLWGKTVKLSDGTTITSDERKKKDFESFGEAHEAMFGLLEPKIFKYTYGTSNRKHFGFVAQQVEKSIEEAGLTTQDVAAFVRTELENGAGDELSLRYSEFIALNTHMIKKCLEEIARLKSEINKLKG